MFQLRKKMLVWSITPVMLVAALMLIGMVTIVAVGLLGSSQWYTIASVADVRQNEPRLYTIQGVEIYLSWVDAKPIALSTRDPHPAGCPIRWSSEENLFIEPCLGSLYMRDGRYHRGPSPRSMDRFAMRVIGNRIQVDLAQVIERPIQP